MNFIHFDHRIYLSVSFISFIFVFISISYINNCFFFFARWITWMHCQILVFYIESFIIWLLKYFEAHFIHFEVNFLWCWPRIKFCSQYFFSCVCMLMQCIHIIGLNWIAFTLYVHWILNINSILNSGAGFGPFSVYVCVCFFC